MALLVVAVALTLGAMEVILRLANLQVTEYAYNLRKYGRLITHDSVGDFTRHVPNARAVIYGAEVRINSAGMRDHERAREKPDGTRRVLVLGDSVTAGLGEAFDDIFVGRLDAILNDGSVAPVEVITAAVPGWNTVAERNYLRAEGLSFAPDIVVLVYVTNDNEILLPWAPRPPLPPLERAWQWLAGRSRIVELATFAYRRRWPAQVDGDKWQMLRDIKRAREQRAAEPHAWENDDPGWLASRRALEDIGAMTRARGIPFVVVLFNLGGPDAPIVTERLGEFATASGVRVIDSYSWFEGRPATSLLNASIHPTAEGHAILAQGIARVVVAEIPRTTMSRGDPSRK